MKKTIELKSTQSSMKLKSILELDEGKIATVIQIDGGRKAQVQLKNLGFYPGVEVSIKKKSAIGGPLMISLNNSNVAIGRGVAAKILVEENFEQNTSDRTT